MIDLIIFSIEKNKYALNIENIVRIIEGVELTNIPTSHEYVDGVMSYESSVIKVLNFRKLIGINSYENQLLSLFEKLKKSHLTWLEELEDSVKNSTEFTKALNPHMCELGKWIDNFSSYDDKLNAILSELVKYHKQLHLRGGEILSLSKKDKDKAINLFDKEMKAIYTSTINALDNFISEIDKVAASLQKLIIYENNNQLFAVKIDSIDDIAHVEDSEVIDSEDEHNSEFLELSGVLDLDGVLINIIKTIKIPTQGD